MKRIFNIALIAALLVSCNNFDNEGINPDNATSGDAIQFYAGENTKTTYFEDEGLGIHWEEGDQVPIIARTKVDQSINNNGELRVRKYYTASSTGASTAFASAAGLEWSAAYTYKDTDNNTVTHGTIGQCETDFFALHCGKQQTTSTTIYNGVLVYSSTEQTQAAANDYSHIGDYTVLASDKVTREAGNTDPIYFQFKNCMSIVALTLKGDASKKITDITLSSKSAPLAFNNAYVAFEDFTTTTDVTEEAYKIYPKSGSGVEGDVSNTVSLTLTEPVALSAEGKLYVVVMPGEHNTNGDITLTATATDCSTATVTMGAITFEKNTVYRPEVTLNNFTMPAIIPDAEVEVSGTDAREMFGTVNFENGSLFINSRTSINGNNGDMATYNIPEKFLYSETDTWQTMSMMNSINPNLDVTVMTAGMVYLLVDGASNPVNTDMVNAGWTAETAIKTANATDDQKTNFNNGVWDETFPIFYTTAIASMTNAGYFTIYSKQFNQGDTFNISNLFTTTATFRGARLVAKRIGWPVAEAEIQKTSALSDGKIHTFEEGARLAENHAAVIATVNNKGGIKSIPAGYVGMDFFTMKRGTTAIPNCRTVTAKVTKSGMLYQIFPLNAQKMVGIKPSGKNKYDGWRAVDYFYIDNVTSNPFYISAKWVEAGEEITTFDYTDAVEANVAVVNYYNTGIFMGKLTVKEVE